MRQVQPARWAQQVRLVRQVRPARWVQQVRLVRLVPWVRPVPLSLGWDGHNVVLSAETRSRTIQNLLRSKTARLGLGPTRDVVLIDATVTTSWPAAEVPAAIAEAYVDRAGWDPRDEAGNYTYVQLAPRRIQAWREANEIQGRTLVRAGEWLG